jgi:hypothetical protein
LGTLGNSWEQLGTPTNVPNRWEHPKTLKTTLAFWNRYFLAHWERWEHWERNCLSLLFFMELETINIKVVKATSLDQFRHSDTQRRKMHMHYFLKMPEGEKCKWQFRWVDELLDPTCLQDWIEKGLVYIFPDDGQVREVG